MNKYKIYNLLGKILALDVVAAHRESVIKELQREDIPWQSFVTLADQQLVLQTLYPKLMDHGLHEYIPEELDVHLKYIFDLTTARNLEVIKQSEKLSKVLNLNGITPLYMKGVGNILDGLYKYPGERILHDIDILVPEQKLEEAADSLFKDGYKSNYLFDPVEKNTRRHYPILYKPGEPIYVEIHRMPVGKRFEKYFNTEMILSTAKKPAGCHNCLVMSDEHNIIHNFMHAQLDHKARIYARESLRNLYDLLKLSSRGDPETVFSNFGHFRRASSGYLDITYKTFGVNPGKRILPGFFMHTYRFRYYIKLKFRFLDISAFVITRIIIVIKRIFSGFVLKPIQAIADKQLRRKIIDKLRSREWYKKQLSFYKRVFGRKK